jgi:hypothetical protein
LFRDFVQHHVLAMRAQAGNRQPIPSARAISCLVTVGRNNLSKADTNTVTLFPLTKYPHGAFPRVLHAASACNIPVISAMPGRVNTRRPEIIGVVCIFLHAAGFGGGQTVFDAGYGL